ncbi:TlpA family protein disulfide reductase [Shewanella sp. SR44-3]|nr:TlpA family protein disulfide reductase [Shewanella sp. SR44-3]
MSLAFSGNSLAAEAELTKAADFSLQDEAGNKLSLGDFKGKPLVLHFWATWCPYCKKLQPGLDKLRLANVATDLQMLAISFNEDEGAMPSQTLKERGIGINTVINGESAARAYGVQGTPTTVFINRSGEIVWQTKISDPNSPELARAVAFILQKE